MQSQGILRASGYAGVIAGIVTLTIVLLPYLYGRPASFSERLELHENPLYLLRLWLSYLNVFAILIAGFGLAVCRCRKSPGASMVGMLFLLFYGATELIGRSVMIFTREYRWVHAAIEAEGDARTALLNSIQTFDQIWAGAFPLILITFSVSAFLFAWAMRGGHGFQRMTCAMLFAAAGLGAVTFVAPYAPSLRPIATWGYVLVQPTSRLLVGLFLLAEARRVPVGVARR